VQINVNVGPTSDLAAVGREIKKAIEASNRKDGGYGIRMGGK
jgi:hypothetical protein